MSRYVAMRVRLTAASYRPLLVASSSLGAVLGNSLDANTRLRGIELPPHRSPLSKITKRMSGSGATDGVGVLREHSRTGSRSARIIGEYAPT